MAEIKRLTVRLDAKVHGPFSEKLHQEHLSAQAWVEAMVINWLEAKGETEIRENPWAKHAEWHDMLERILSARTREGVEIARFVKWIIRHGDKNIELEARAEAYARQSRRAR